MGTDKKKSKNIEVPSMHKRGFTLIELIVVMAVLAILVLLAAPKLLGQSAEARQTQIQNDLKVVDQAIEELLVKEHDLPEDWPLKTGIDVELIEGKVHDFKGVVDEVSGSEFQIISPAFVKEKSRSKLKGDFITNDDGKTYYIDDKKATSQNPDSKDTDADSKDTDVEEEGTIVVEAGSVVEVVYNDNANGTTTATGTVTKDGVLVPNVTVPLTVENGTPSDLMPITDENGEFEVDVTPHAPEESVVVGVDDSLAPGVTVIQPTPVNLNPYDLQISESKLSYSYMPLGGTQRRTVSVHYQINGYTYSPLTGEYTIIQGNGNPSSSLGNITLLVPSAGGLLSELKPTMKGNDSAVYTVTNTGNGFSINGSTNGANHNFIGLAHDGKGTIVAISAHENFDNMVANVYSSFDSGRAWFDTHIEPVGKYVSGNRELNNSYDFMESVTHEGGLFIITYKTGRKLYSPDGLAWLKTEEEARNYIDPNTIPDTASNFSFEPTTGTITGYKGARTEIVIPSEINGVPVRHIGDNAFRSVFLEGLVLPDGLETIGSHAFAYGRLTEVVIPNSVTAIGERAFFINQLKTLRLPDGLQSLGKDAFWQNKITGEIVIPTSLTEISNSAFSTNQIESVVLHDNITYIGSYAFGSNNITSLKLPNSLETISFELPNSLKTIGAHAFSNNRLSGIITVPASVTSIGQYFVAANTDVTGLMLPKHLSSFINQNHANRLVLARRTTTKELQYEEYQSFFRSGTTYY